MGTSAAPKSAASLGIVEHALACQCHYASTRCDMLVADSAANVCPTLHPLLHGPLLQRLFAWDHNMSQRLDLGTMSFAIASPLSLAPPSPAPSTPEPSTPAEARASGRDEDRLFRHIRDYTWSQRSKITKSWVLEYGFDIEKVSERRWVYRLCIQKTAPKPCNVIACGTRNAERHLWDHHKIQDPSGRNSALAS